MAVFSRFRRRRTPYGATTEEERIARYVYLLNTLPASVIESAHATAFADLPPERRREMFEQLRPFLADSERDAAAEDPTVIARLVRRAEEHKARRAAEADAAAQAAADPARTAVAVDDRDPRDAVDARAMLLNVGVMTIVANQFLVSSSMAAYFTVGAGSLQLGGEPAWIGETYDPGSGGTTAARAADTTAEAASTGADSAVASTPGASAAGSTAVGDSAAEPRAGTGPQHPLIANAAPMSGAAPTLDWCRPLDPCGRSRS